MFGVEGYPDRFRVLTLVGRETQILLAGLAPPAVFGVACRGDDLSPQGVERIRHVKKRYLGLCPGRELFRWLGYNGIRPELTGTGELLLRSVPPGRRVPVRYRGQLALDDVLECSFDGCRVKRAIAEPLDDLVVLTGCTG